MFATYDLCVALIVFGWMQLICAYDVATLDLDFGGLMQYGSLGFEFPVFVFWLFCCFCFVFECFDFVACCLTLLVCVYVVSCVLGLCGIYLCVSLNVLIWCIIGCYAAEFRVFWFCKFGGLLFGLVDFGFWSSGVLCFLVFLDLWC